MSAGPQELRNIAHSFVGDAVAAGLLAPVQTTECRSCGSEARCYHHPDYTRPGWVIPLCDGCHAQTHAGNAPEPLTNRWHPRPAKNFRYPYQRPEAAHGAMVWALAEGRPRAAFMRKDHARQVAATVTEAEVLALIARWRRHAASAPPPDAESRALDALRRARLAP